MVFRETNPATGEEVVILPDRTVKYTPPSKTTGGTSTTDKSPSYDKTVKTVEATIPPDDVLRSQMIKVAQDQGYRQEGIYYQGQLIPYGRFIIKLSSGQEVTPSSFGNAVNYLVEDTKYQYRLQGSYYVQAGYTPIETEAGLAYQKTEPIDEKKPPGITQPSATEEYTKPAPTGGFFTTPEQHNFLMGIGQTILGGLDFILGGIPRYLSPGETGVSQFDIESGFARIATPGTSEYTELVSQGWIPYSEAQERGIMTPSQGVIGLFSITQAPFFVGGLGALGEVTSKMPIISKVVTGASTFMGGAMGYQAVKGIVENPNPAAKVYDTFLLGSMIFGGGKVSGLKLSDLSYTNLARMGQAFKRFAGNEPLLQAPKEYSAIMDLNRPVRGLYDSEGRLISDRPRLPTRQATLEEGRFFYNKETGTIERYNYGSRPTPQEVLYVKSKPTVYANRPMTVEEVLAKMSRDAKEEFIRRKPIEEIKPKQTTIEDYITRIKLDGEKGKVSKIGETPKFKVIENKPKTIEEILTKVSEDSKREYFQRGKPKNEIPKETTPLTLEDFAKERYRMIIDKEGKVEVLKMETLTNEERLRLIGERKKNPLPRNERLNRLWDIIEQGKENTTREGAIAELIKVETRVKPQESTVTTGDSTGGIGLYSSRGFLKQLALAESGIAAESSYWAGIKPSNKTIIERKSGFGERMGLGFKTDIGVIQGGEMGTGIKTGQIDLSKVINGQPNISSEMQHILNKQINLNNVKEIVGERNDLLPLVLQGLENKQLQRDIQDQMQKQLLRQEIILEDFTTTRTKEPTVKKPKIILSGDDVLTEFEEKVNPSFIVKVRGRQYRHGVKVGDDSFHSISKPLNYDDALSLLFNKLGNTEKATGKLEPTNAKPTKPSKQVEHWINNVFKYKDKGNNIWVEESRFRMDSPGEIQAITMKGIEAKTRGLKI